MIRKAAVLTLIAAATPGFACTGISLKAQDGAAIRGRTLEFGFPMQSNVLVIPAGKEMSGTLPDGGKGLVYTSRYAIVGANALGLPAILDGLNDQGLSVGLFYFPNYAKYTDVTPENAMHAIAPQEFGMWVLANFATVDEVKEGVKSIVVVPTPAPGLGSPQGAVAGALFFIQDRSGKSIVIEPVDGTLKVHDAPLGIMTNAPTYDWHMTNLQNYVNLSVKDVEGAKIGPVALAALGLWLGLAWHARRLHAPVALRARGDLQPVRGAERHGRGRRALRLPHLESVRHPERIGAELGHRRHGRRDHRMDERRRSQESALVFQDLHRPVDPRGRFEGSGRGRQGRGAHPQDGRHVATHRRRLDEFRRGEVT
jgi:hypothetical protein